MDISNPQNPQIITANQILQGNQINDIQLNGSGLGFASALGGALVLNAPNPSTVNQVFTVFMFPGLAERTALASGFAYVADGTGGLQLINYLQFDTGTTPPTIHLDPIAGDVNPGQTGLQLYEGTTITVPNRISDDVQVRSVELMFDGVVVLKDLSYPYDLTAVLPKIADTGNQVVLQVRATDTGGNVQLSDPIVIDLLKDVTPPTVAAIDPPAGSTQPISRRQVTLTFSEALDRSTVVPSSFVLHGPTGDVVPVSVDLRQHDTRVEIVYPPLAQGDYTFTIHGAAIKDRAGNAMGAADSTSTFSVSAVTRQPTIRWVNQAGGSWSDPNNWLDAATNQPRLPTATDDVLIDVPTDAQITVGAGTFTVNSIISNERFQIVGGRLNVTDTIQVNNTFLLDGTSTLSPGTLKGTVLRGTGGQGITAQRESRLDGATVLTDINLVTTSNNIAHLRIANGLALTGTLTATGAHGEIGIEGTETISSGTFLGAGATFDTGKLYFVPVGTATVTLGHDVLVTGNAVMWDEGGGFQTSVPNVLNVINQGTITAAGSNFNYKFETDATSFVNQGTINSDENASLLILAKTWTNTATGHITLNGVPLIQNLIRGGFGGVSTASWSNAGTIEVINSKAQFMPTFPSANQSWSNTGSIIVNHSFLNMYGKFTSDDVVNIRSSGYVIIFGQMDNTGRTFTFNNDTKSYILAPNGRIFGGTLVMTGLASRLEFEGGTLDGVTIQGDVGMGQLVPDNLNGGLTANTGDLHVVHGLTLNGTMSVYSSGNIVDFDGAQTISGSGTIQFLLATGGGGGTGTFVRAYTGGPVVFDSTLTLRASGTGGYVTGNIINNAAVVIDANSGFIFKGAGNLLNPTFAGPFINRSPITVGTGKRLTLEHTFVNEARINVPGGNITVDALYGFKNSNVIDLTGGGRLIFDALLGSDSRTVTTADLGTIIDSGAFVGIQGKTVLDNTGTTLTIDGTGTWFLNSGSIVGGTIQVDNTATFQVYDGTLKDVTVNGNIKPGTFGTMSLVGDLTLNGTVQAATIQFGDFTNYPNLPVRIRAGVFDLPGFSATLAAAVNTPSITLDPGVQLIGAGVTASFSTPIINQGVIAADTEGRSTINRNFIFSAAPITNQGTLKAVNQTKLQIASLAAPNSGIVSAAAGSTVAFTGAFAQAAAGTVHVDVGGTATTQFGLVAITGAATLAGTLDVQFASGFTPVAGNSFKVLTCASETGQFATIHVTGLASGLVVTPQYNGTDLTLVVNTAAAGMAVALNQTAPTSSQGQTPSFGVGLEQLFAGNSMAIAPSATTNSTFRLPPVTAFPIDDEAKSASPAAHASSDENWPSNQLWTDDVSAASDEVFASLGDEWLLTT